MNEIYIGDCIESMKKMPDQCVNMCVTSPPYYGLRNYGVEGQIGLEETPEQYVQKMVEVFREVKRILRDDGTVWLNIGDSYSGSGKGQWKETGEYDKYRSKTEGMKLNACNSKNIGLKPKDLIGIPWRVAFALQADGWYLRQDIIWHKPNPMPQSVRDRCTTAHEYIFLLSKKPHYYYDWVAIQEDAKWERWGDQTAPKEQQGAGKIITPKTKEQLENMPKKKNKRDVWTVAPSGFKGAHFATYSPELIRPCVLAGCPEKVCSKCGMPHVRSLEVIDSIDRSSQEKAVTFVPGRSESRHNNKDKTVLTKVDHGFVPQCGCNAEATKGVVFDPFMGAGTTALVALQENRAYLGTELNQEYANIANNRLAEYINKSKVA